MSVKIEELIKMIPDETGVYLMKDSDEKIIYIGKAKSLRTRVKSYFSNEKLSPKISIMVPKIAKIDFITTDNEVEALILEDTLVKKYKPRYNTLLKDDKKFPWIEITDEKYPRILVTRKPITKSKRKNHKYFGPYVNAGALYSTIDFLKQVFPLKQCKVPVFKTKPCMNYHIHRCLGPCQDKVSSEDYKLVLSQVELFLTGKQNELLKKLENMMEKSSQALEFEKAAKYRDTIKAIEKVVETQKIVSDDNTLSQDVFAFSSDKIYIAVVLLRIREGKLVYKEGYDLIIDKLDTDKETFWAFLENYYQTVEPVQIPKEIIVSYAAEDSSILASLLSKRSGSKVKFTTPKARKKFELLQMAEKNALITLENANLKAQRMLQYDWNALGSTLQEKLLLKKFPLRIECFDISHLSGTDTVASMVVFIKGKPVKSEYRKYKIRITEGKIDDFAAMNEVISRRYKKTRSKRALPDLIVIDGGKGQLSSACKALKELDIKDPQIVSLAKKFEEIFIPGADKPLIFEKDSPALYLFQQIRDEAHRFAVSFQRQLRSKRMTKSALDNLISIGKKRKALLLKYFGTPENIYKASIEELKEVKGINEKLAMFIYKQLNE